MKYYHFYYETRYLFTATAREYPQVREQLRAAFSHAGYFWSDSGEIVESSKPPRTINASRPGLPLEEHRVNKARIDDHLEHDLYRPVLMEKMEREWEALQQSLKGKTIYEIIPYNREICGKEDILERIEDIRLTNDELKLLCESRTPLQDIYDEYYSRGYVDDGFRPLLDDSIRTVANGRSRQHPSRQQPEKEPERQPEAAPEERDSGSPDDATNRIQALLAKAMENTPEEKNIPQRHRSELER